MNLRTAPPTLPLLVTALALLCLLPAGAPAQSAKAVDYGQGSTMIKVADPFIPLPPFNRTYNSSSGYARGYYFNTPTTFIVTHLNVPNESNQTTQAVAIYTWTTKPTAWPTMMAGTPKFYSATAKAGAPVPVVPPLKINAGDWVGVVGGCHTPTAKTLSMSYGPKGLFASNVLGKATSLQRLVFQGDFITNNGAGSYMATEDAYEVARVEIHVAGQGSVGTPTVPVLTTTALPGLGRTANLNLAAKIPGALNSLVVGGRLRTPGTGLPTPFGVLLVNPPLLLLLPVAGGASGDVKIAIPNDKALIGATVRFQGMVNALPKNFGMSNGTEWTVGL